MANIRLYEGITHKKIIYTTFSNILYTMYAYFAFHFKQTKTKYASPQVRSIAFTFHFLLYIF